MARRTLSGCRAIVTGASSGIGWAMAVELAKRQSELLVTARCAEKLDQLVGEITNLGGRAIPVPGDLTDESLRERLVTRARMEWGGLDLLINNAGVGAIGPFLEADPGRLRRVMEINFFAPAELTRLAAPLLQNGHQPLIVNIGSVLGHRAVPFKVEYCASKFAMHGFSDALRSELEASGIDLLLVSPSTTNSEFLGSLLAGERSEGALRGMSPTRVVRQAIRAMKNGRDEVILSAGGKLLVWSDRLFPTLVNRAIARYANRRRASRG